MFYITVFSAFEDLSIFKSYTEHSTHWEEGFWTEYSFCASSETTSTFTLCSVPPGAGLSGRSQKLTDSLSLRLLVGPAMGGTNRRQKKGTKVRMFLPLSLTSKPQLVVMPLYQKSLVRWPGSLPRDDDNVTLLFTKLSPLPFKTVLYSVAS